MCVCVCVYKQIQNSIYIYIYIYILYMCIYRYYILRSTNYQVQTVQKLPLLYL